MSVPKRFHLTLTSAGRPVSHGWWSDRTVAHGKFLSWVGAYGTIPGAHLTLVDEVEARILTAWPNPD